MIMNSGAVVSQNGYSVGNIAKDIIEYNNITLDANSTSVNTSFSVMSVGELGFSTDATYGEVCDKAIEKGFSLCKPENGLWLFFNDSNGFVFNDLVVAMLPLSDRDGVHYSVFRICKSNDSEYKWLGCYYGKRDRVCSVNQKFVFTR